jgi:phosphopantothenoylcysteine synthetase/decarboxylase
MDGKKVLISAGPMRAQIDPVRYIQNRSSGKMGLELARAFSKTGALNYERSVPVKEQLTTITSMDGDLFLVTTKSSTNATTTYTVTSQKTGATSVVITPSPKLLIQRMYLVPSK